LNVADNNVIKTVHFPSAGLDLSVAFGQQPARETAAVGYARTTADAVNVRAFEPLADRCRGGSRSGLRKYVPALCGSANLIQHLAVLVDPQAQALWANYKSVYQPVDGSDPYYIEGGAPGPNFPPPPGPNYPFGGPFPEDPDPGTRDPNTGVWSGPNVTPDPGVLIDGLYYPTYGGLSGPQNQQFEGVKKLIVMTPSLVRNGPYDFLLNEWTSSYDPTVSLQAALEDAFPGVDVSVITDAYPSAYFAGFDGSDGFGPPLQPTTSADRIALLLLSPWFPLALTPAPTSASVQGFDFITPGPGPSPQYRTGIYSDPNDPTAGDWGFGAFQTMLDMAVAVNVSQLVTTHYRMFGINNTNAVPNYGETTSVPGNVYGYAAAWPLADLYPYMYEDDVPEDAAIVDDSDVVAAAVSMIGTFFTAP
jgi:hypothetical protein